MTRATEEMKIKWNPIAEIQNKWDEEAVKGQEDGLLLSLTEELSHHLPYSTLSESGASLTGNSLSKTQSQVPR